MFSTADLITLYPHPSPECKASKWNCELWANISIAPSTPLLPLMEQLVEYVDGLHENCTDITQKGLCGKRNRQMTFPTSSQKCPLQFSQSL